jgi:hypothetical protein
LASRNVTSDQVKQQITNQVYEILKPEIDSKTANMNSIACAIAFKTIKRTIKVAVCRISRHYGSQ